MKHFPWEKLVLLLAASFAAYNYGLAGGYIEHTRFSIGGLIAGVVVNISLAIAASRYGSIKGDKRTRQAQLAFVVMLLLSPLLVSPVIFYSLPETFLGWWVLRAAWAVGWPLVADLAIVLAGAVSGKGLVSLTAETETARAAQGAPSAASVRRRVRPSASAVRLECAALATQYACTEPQCGWTPSVDALVIAAEAGKNPKTAAASAKAGHVKARHKPIALDTSLLINKGDKSKP